MDIVTIHFREILFDSMDLGDEEHMVSKVYFSIVAGDRAWSELETTVRLTVGANYATDPLEVELPADYDGPMHHDRFRGCVESYFKRRAVSMSGPVVGSFRMRNTRIAAEDDCTFLTEDE